MNLSGDWAFNYTTAHSDQVPPAEAFKATMPVPGCWDDSFDRSKAQTLWPDARFNPAQNIPYRYPLGGKGDAVLPFILGTGWYRKQLDVPTSWKGGQVTLDVGRVVMEGWVYVNGQEVHHHFGISTKWEVPLAQHLAFGRPNDLVIAVDNTATNRIGCQIRGYKGRRRGNLRARDASCRGRGADRRPVRLS